MILAGDVGGTKVDLVLCKFDNGQLLTVHDHKYHARDFPGLVQIVEAFLREVQANARAVGRCAGGLLWGAGSGTPWPVEADQSSLGTRLRASLESISRSNMFS